LFLFDLLNQLNGDTTVDFCVCMGNEHSLKSPENPNFWGVNRRFQAKLAKYLKFHVIETTASISNQILHNDRDHQEVVAGGPNRRPTNPRWRTAAILKKPLNRHISATG